MAVYGFDENKNKICDKIIRTNITLTYYSNHVWTGSVELANRLDADKHYYLAGHFWNWQGTGGLFQKNYYDDAENNATTKVNILLYEVNNNLIMASVIHDDLDEEETENKTLQLTMIFREYNE